MEKVTFISGQVIDKLSTEMYNICKRICGEENDKINVFFPTVCTIINAEKYLCFFRVSFYGISLK